MSNKHQRLHIDPYYCLPLSDGYDPNSPMSSPSPSFSYSPPTDMLSTASRTPMSAGPDWRLCFVLCLYDFTPTDPDHLPFRKNEMLEIVKKEDSGWWAALREDRVGWVPSTFVTELTNEAAEDLLNVREELRVYEFKAERLYTIAEPISTVPRFFDATFSPLSAHEKGHEHNADDNWVPIVEPGGKAPFMQVMSPSGLIATDFPDDVAPPSSGVSPSPHLHSHTDFLDKYSTDSESEPSSNQNSLARPGTCRPSPTTPMPHSFRPAIAPFCMNKPTPPPPMCPSPARAFLRCPLGRSRSDSAPSNRRTRRRPIMVNDFSSLSRLSTFLDSPRPDTAADDLQTAFDGLRTPPVVCRSDKVLKLTGDGDAQAFHNAKVAQACLPWFLQPTYTPNDIKMEYDGSVRAGTLPALVERLTVDPLKLPQEKMYRDTILTTFSTFTTASELFDLLVERYEMGYPASITQEEFNEWIEKKLRPMQQRILTVLSMWLENHGLLQDDPHMAPRLREFLGLVISPPTLALSAKSLLQSLDKLETADHPLPPVPTAPPKWRKPPRTPKNELLNFEAVDVAAQLTLYEYRLYANIRPRECLLWAKTQAGTGVVRLATFCATHDRLATWVKSSVLAIEGLGKRADMVDFWIKVAEKCRALNNFSSMTAIVAALSSAVLTRLHLTWAHVGRGSQLEALERLCEPNGNFSKYRAAVQAVDGSCIPFIGIFLTDIVHIQDQMKDNVSFPLSDQSSSPSSGTCSTVPRSRSSSSSSFSPNIVVSSSYPASSVSTSAPAPTGPPLINFVKRQKWRDAVHAIVRFQGRVPGVAENAPLLALVTEHLALAGEKLKDPAVFWTRSQELQQSEVAHADIRKGLEAAGF